MAVSGTISQTVVRTGQIIDTAYRRCRIPSSKISWEMLETAKHQLYVLLSSLSNKGQLLWTIRESFLGFQPAIARIQLPTGIVDADKVFFRTVTRESGGTPASSDGGTAANAFDGDVDTACTQTAPNGNISYDWGSGNSPTVTYVGVMANGTSTWTLTFQSSTDGVTWTTVYSAASASYTDKLFTWYAISSPVAGRYFRVAVSGGGTLNVRELVFGINPTDVEMARMNQDDFTALPNRTFQGDPNQYWLERLYNTAYANVWPAPNGYFNSMVVWNRRYVMDVGQVYDSLEIPQRWIDGIEWDLAFRVYHEIPPEVFTPENPFDANYLAYLGNQSVRYIGEAFDEERDKSPVKFGPRIGCYNA